ncbi:MAG: response regulator [Thioalkalispiraceae bacterium]|jgi:excisionase family DNA binding protein
MSKKFLTPNEAAAVLNVSPVTVRQWAQKGMLEATRTAGGHRRFAVQEIERFAAQHGISVQPRNNDQLKILIVDDDDQLRHYLQEHLEYRFDDIALESARDGFDAGSKIHRFQPDIVLLDLMMPGIDGYEVCRAIKQDADTRHIRVIAMTGYYSDENVKKILDEGAVACLRKPLDINTLIDVLKSNN